MNLGGQFLVKHVKDATTSKCYFSLTRDGKAIKVQRTLFSECFYFMAMSELFRATADVTYKVTNHVTERTIDVFL